MDNTVLEFIAEQTKALLEAPTCSAETKEAAQNWLTALGSSKQGEETERYLAELEEDIMPIDQLIGFAGSEAGAAYFGTETAAGIAAHAEEIKSGGAKYCDCPACAIVEMILKKAGKL